MAISVHVYLPDEFENLLDKIIESDKRIRSKSAFIGFCIDEIAQRDYFEVYEGVLKKYEKRKPWRCLENWKVKWY